MTRRKTIKVEALITILNEMLAKSTCHADVRRGAINIVDEALHLSGNYRGFLFLISSEVPANEKPGINVNADGSVMFDFTKRFFDTDATRVKYI